VQPSAAAVRSAAARARSDHPTRRDQFYWRGRTPDMYPKPGSRRRCAALLEPRPRHSGRTLPEARPGTCRLPSTRYPWVLPFPSVKCSPAVPASARSPVSTVPPWRPLLRQACRHPGASLHGAYRQQPPRRLAGVTSAHSGPGPVPPARSAAVPMRPRPPGWTSVEAPAPRAAPVRPETDDRQIPRPSRQGTLGGDPGTRRRSRIGRLPARQPVRWHTDRLLQRIARLSAQEAPCPPNPMTSRLSRSSR
jgi:hypothetical protein